MIALQKSFKTEIAPTPAQMRKINQTIGVCRFIYNLYIAKNKKEYKATKKFVSGMTFSKWLNNEYIPSHPEVGWIFYSIKIGCRLLYLLLLLFI